MNEFSKNIKLINRTDFDPNGIQYFLWVDKYTEKTGIYENEVPRHWKKTRKQLHEDLCGVKLLLENHHERWASRKSCKKLEKQRLDSNIRTLREMESNLSHAVVDSSREHSADNSQDMSGIGISRRLNLTNVRQARDSVRQSISSVTGNISKATSNFLGRFQRQRGNQNTRGEDRTPLDRVDAIGEKFIDLMISATINGGLKQVGIFRVPGRAGPARALVDAYFLGGNNSFVQLFEEIDEDDVNTFISALKQFIQRLREPLIPYEAYDQLMNTFRTSISEADQIDQIRSFIHQLPLINLRVFKKLIQFFLQILDAKEYNKMDPKNMAICSAFCWPSLMRPTVANGIMEFILNNYDQIFDTEMEQLKMSELSHQVSEGRLKLAHLKRKQMHEDLWILENRMNSLQLALVDKIGWFYVTEDPEKKRDYDQLASELWIFVKDEETARSYDTSGDKWDDLSDELQNEQWSSTLKAPRG